MRCFLLISGFLFLSAAQGLPATTYADWVSQNFPSGAPLTGMNDNPAGDGTPNLLKYALGMDPNLNSQAGLPTTFLAPDGNLAMTFNEDSSLSDLTYIVETSSDLQNWFWGPGAAIETGGVPLQGTQSSVTYEATIGPPVMSGLFMRLVVFDGPPTAPGYVTVTPGYADELHLSWADTDPSATFFLIEESIDGGNTWNIIATLGAGSTSYDVTGLDQTQSYQFQVVSENNDGSTSSSSTPTTQPPPAPPQYAVIDLGANMVPVKVTNSGYVLSFPFDSDYASAGSVWFNGQSTTLQPNNASDFWDAIDIGEDGTVIGDEGVTRQRTIMTTSPSGTTSQTVPILVTDLAIWPSGSPAPNLTDGRTILVQSSDGLGDTFQDQFQSDDTGVGIAANDSIQFTYQSPNDQPDYGGADDLFKGGQEVGPGYANGSDNFATLLQHNNNGDMIFSNYLSTGTNWLNNTNTPLGFSPTGMSNEVTIGGNTTIYATGWDSNSNTVWWDGATVHGDLTNNNYNGSIPYINGATATVTDANGNPVTKPALQIVAGPQTWEMNPATGQFGTPQLLDNLVPASAGWTAITASSTGWEYHYGNAINDGGAIVGTALYSGTNTAIAAGSHGVMLLPLKFVRETTPGSGDFEPITDNGLDDKAQLPIFASETGQGMTETDSGGGYTMTAALSTDLSSISTATISVTYTISGGGSYTGTLTETAAGSGIFKDSGGTNVLTLTPSNQTTSSTTPTNLSATITIPSLSISSQPVTLIGTAPLNFQASATMMDVFLSGALSTTAPNTITVSFYNSTSETDAVALTETGVNTRVFQDSTGGIILTMTGFTGGTSMSISVNETGATPSSFGATLTETTPTSLQYSNYTRTYGTASNETPSTDGQSVFYVQFPGSTATSVTLLSGTNQVTVQATPVTGQPNLLRTGKLVLLEPGDTFSGSGITTLTVSPPTGGGNPTVQLQMYGQTVVDPGTDHDAYLGFGPVENTDGSVHLGQIQTILTQNLGWACPTIHAVSVKSDVLHEISKHSLWYMFTHGLTHVWDTPPLLTFALFNSPDPNDHNVAELSPSDVAANIGNNTYELVFFNACFSADQTSGSAAPNFATNFKAREYVGWAGDQHDIVAFTAGKNFFLASQTHTKAKDAATAVNQNLSWLSRSNLQLLSDHGDSIDLSGSASNSQ